jgi:cell division septal protein FtsQ
MSAAAGPFLRPAQPQRRRRRSRLGRAAQRLGRLLPVLLVPVAVWAWLTGGDTFALQAVDTEGSPRIPPDWIVEALAPEFGGNLLALPLDRVQERLEEHPWLGRIEARKELPDRLRVAVEERVAAAVLETEEGLFYVDRDGHRIAPLEPGDSPGALVRIAPGSTATGVSPALATGEVPSIRRALELERALVSARGPSWSDPLLWIEVIGDDDFRLYAGELPFPIVVRSEGASERLELLEQLRPDILERVPTIAEVDLRFTSRIVVRPDEAESRRRAAEEKRAELEAKRLAREALERRARGETDAESGESAETPPAEPLPHPDRRFWEPHLFEDARPQPKET